MICSFSSSLFFKSSFDFLTTASSSFFFIKSFSSVEEDALFDAFDWIRLILVAKFFGGAGRGGGALGFSDVTTLVLSSLFCSIPVLQPEDDDEDDDGTTTVVTSEVLLLIVVIFDGGGGMGGDTFFVLLITGDTARGSAVEFDLTQADATEPRVTLVGPAGVICSPIDNFLARVLLGDRGPEDDDSLLPLPRPRFTVFIVARISLDLKSAKFLCADDTELISLGS
mmetsp:Transcript_27777/g.32891  ORF Transcript_27777/g.32891 Transcript_27777/m.32891 type:complete len:225 (-) Transcript_27777:1228-1902(-)